jgi:hypothetical protein
LIPHSLAGSLTADFLGQELDEIGMAEVEETTKELLNMICGKALSLFDPKAVFKLGIPEMVHSGEISDTVFSGNGEDITLLYNASENQLAVKIVIHS